MSEQHSLFDGGQLRDEAVARAEHAANEHWMRCATACLLLCVRDETTFTADDVASLMQRLYPTATTHEPRAMGAVFTRAKKEGWCTPTPYFQPTDRPQGHKGPRRIWRSNKESI
jgi:hypothetical protein